MRLQNKISVLGDDVEDIGGGVSRPTRVGVKKSANTMVSLDGPTVWVDEPVIEDQIKDPALWKIGSRYVRVFDLSNPNEFDAYNVLLAKTSEPNTNLFITNDERKFSEKDGSWKVFVMCMSVKFKKIIKDSKNER